MHTVRARLSLAFVALAILWGGACDDSPAQKRADVVCREAIEQRRPAAEVQVLCEMNRDATGRVAYFPMFYSTPGYYHPGPSIAPPSYAGTYYHDTYTQAPRYVNVPRSSVRNVPTTDVAPRSRVTSGGSRFGGNTSIAPPSQTPRTSSGTRITSGGSRFGGGSSYSAPRSTSSGTRISTGGSRFSSGGRRP